MPSVPAKDRRQPHASRQAPWRNRVRSAGGTMLTIVVLLAFSGMYLAVNEKLARAGRELMVLEAQREEIYRSNNELRAKLAIASSAAEMLDRAKGLGFRPARAEDVDFIVVEGYQPPEPFIAPIPPALPAEGSAMLSPAFTETLGSWLGRVIAGNQ